MKVMYPETVNLSPAAVFFYTAVECSVIKADINLTGPGAASGNSNINGTQNNPALVCQPNGGNFEIVFNQPSYNPSPDSISWYRNDVLVGTGKTITIPFPDYELCSIKAKCGASETIMWVAPCRLRYVDGKGLWWWNVSQRAQAPPNYPEQADIVFESVVDVTSGPGSYICNWVISQGSDKMKVLPQGGGVPADRAAISGDTKVTAVSEKESASLGDVSMSLVYSGPRGSVSCAYNLTVDTGAMKKLTEGHVGPEFTTQIGYRIRMCYQLYVALRPDVPIVVPVNENLFNFRNNPADPNINWIDPSPSPSFYVDNDPQSSSPGYGRFFDYLAKYVEADIYPVPYDGSKEPPNLTTWIKKVDQKFYLGITGSGNGKEVRADEVIYYQNWATSGWLPGEQ